MNAPALPPIASVEGDHSPEGAELREVFSRCLTRAPGGAQLVVTRHGGIIADVAGGGVGRDTPIQLFSVSKLIVAIAAAHAHAAGVIDLDAPLSGYWPAFARPETGAITARMILDHSSGISAVTRPLSLEELVAGALEDEVAVQDPLWEPGTQHGYGAFTYGALMAGVFAHGAGIGVQEYVAERVVGPVGGGFSFGARTEEARAALAPLSFSPPVLTEAQANGLMSGQAIQDGAMLPIMQDAPGFFGDARVQAAAWPAMSGVGTARSVARVLNGALGFGGPRILDGEALEGMIAERRHGMDRMLGHVSRFGSGVELPHGFMPYFGGRSFGHQGAGGSVAAADPETGLVLIYTSTHTASTVGGSDQAVVMMAAARQLIGV